MTRRGTGSNRGPGVRPRPRVVSAKARREGGYCTISEVAERFDIHPQTLRLYEREGLICPARSQGNTRLYDGETIRRLEIVLALTRELGVNLAGVEIILNLRSRLEEMTERVDHLLRVVQVEVQERRAGLHKKDAIVRIPRGHLVRHDP